MLPLRRLSLMGGNSVQRLRKSERISLVIPQKVASFSLIWSAVVEVILGQRGVVEGSGGEGWTGSDKGQVREEWREGRRVRTAPLS